MKRISACFLGLAFLLTLLSVIGVQPVSAASAAPPAIPTTGDVWDGSVEAPTKIVQKDGVNYYEITKCSQLAYVAQEGGEWLARNYILANNLILNDVVLEWDEEGNLLNDPSTLHEWTPIGGFSGIFDGNNRVIAGAYVNQENDYGDIGLFRWCRSIIRSLGVTNSYIRGSNASSVGGLCGGSAFIAGFGVMGCTFNGMVIGENSHSVGGICGNSQSTITNCTFFGKTISKKSSTGFSSTGGICGAGYCENSANYGFVSGEAYVGGICGSGDCFKCINYGTITGENYIGGVCGRGICRNCCNTATIMGNNAIGGIIGAESNNDALINCYNIGNVACISDSNMVGAIVGSDGAVWNKDTITGCYYLKSDTVNTNLYGCGGVSSADLEPSGFYAKSAAQLKQQSTFEGWDFTDTWRIDPALNNGYPYLAWQDVSDIPLTGLTLTQSTLSLGVGDVAYLTANPQPATAALPALTWKSGNDSVVTVNESGRVTAAGAGTTTITASGGGYSASCSVTVSARAPEEYRLGALTVRDANGAALTSIPRGSFLVTIPVTKQTAGGGSMVFLACYDADGRYKGLLYVSVEDGPVGATVKLTLPVDNTAGGIARLKAFCIASLGSMTPLGASVSFPAQ